TDVYFAWRFYSCSVFKELETFFYILTALATGLLSYHVLGIMSTAQFLGAFEWLLPYCPVLAMRLTAT
ncbi:MAG: hypothetical protein NUK65_07910, partial [Firmicutes bacterium]|nr:hypothetical protein [Bacillota bacterium]